MHASILVAGRSNGGTGMAVLGWLLLGAIAGVVVNRLAGQSARSMPITMMGAMTGALMGGTLLSTAIGRGAIGVEAVVALVALLAAAVARIGIEEGRRGH
jgi:hypothetical protein